MNEVLTKAEQQVLDALLPKHKDLLEDMIARQGAKETARRIVWVKMLNEEQLDLAIKLAKEMLNEN